MEKEKPIVALDLKGADETREFLRLFSEDTLNVKIGMELFYSAGPNFVKEIVEAGHDVFLDLKLYDIPNTVERAMVQLAKLGVSMVNVHASGGKEMMVAAKEGLLRGTPAGAQTPLLIAVTQLTSHDPKVAMSEQQLAVTLEESVLHLGQLSKESGLDGVVCSPLETKRIKEEMGKDFLTITPGIRLETSQKDDQKRIATPKRAAKWGSDYIVVGRPITQASHPVEAYQAITKEWQAALEGATA
jgi:orotidine-5'-phosphate decarboxylase